MNRAPASRSDAGWIERVATAGEFLRERLHRTAPSRTPLRFQRAAFRERWAALFDGDPDTLSRRLRWGVGAAHARSPGPRPLPTWARRLVVLVDAAAAASREAGHAAPIARNDPIPFEHALLPLVVAARRMLRERMPHAIDGDGPADLTVDAWRMLERALLAQLAIVATRVLDREFSRGRPYGETLLIDLGLTPTLHDERYRAFCRRIADDGGRALFIRYPVLGRLVVTCVDQWIDATFEFVTRLRTDRSAIADRFGDGRPIGAVTAIDPALSDRHAKGRTVTALTFASGMQIVYKPKDLALDEGLSSFLDWCRARDASLALAHPRVLNRGAYGWIEFVAQRPCIDRDDARRFFERAGMLLCVLHVLRATDCHHENVVARGSDLIVVDTEALLHPRELGAGEQRNTVGPTAPTSERFLDSVLRTGLLPRYSVSADRHAAFDISGLGSAQGQRVPHAVHRWHAINTDAMHVRFEATDFPPEKNVAMLDGLPLAAKDHVDPLLAGFRAMYRGLLAHRTALLSADGPLAGLAGRRVRYILRDSQSYGTLLDGALAPGSLRSGAEFSLGFERLAQTLMTSPDRPAAWTLFDAELRALERLDIPLFTVDTSGRQLQADGEPVLEDGFALSGLADARALVLAMDEADLAWQCQLIAGSFDAVAASVPVDERTSTPIGPRAVDDAFALAEARRIADEIARRAIRDPAGGLTWVGLGYLLRARKYQFRVLGHNLYDGVPGIAVFFAALYRTTGDAHHRRLALEAMAGVRSFLRQRRDHPQWRDDADAFLGGAIGLGSVIYGLATVARLVDEPALFDDARLVVEQLGDDRIRQDDEIDVMGGAAGALLGLLALHDASPDAATLHAASTCGRHLIDRQEAMSAGGRAWCTLGPTPLAGMSHGAAGIAYALARLHAATGEAAFLHAASAGIAYERTLRTPGSGHWADLRPVPEGSPREADPVQWCHGAPGIALARIGSVHHASALDVGDDIDVAIASTRQVGLGSIDHLCCGNFGRVEALLVGAAVRDRPEWRRDAEALARAAVDRAHDRGSYGLFTNLPSTPFQPGFFQGLSGIGYQLLRIARPDLPSVLMWT